MQFRRMGISGVFLVCFLLAVLRGTAGSTQTTNEPQEEVLLDDLPEDVTASMEVRDRWFVGTEAAAEPEEFVVEDLQRWLPGQALRVAFLGGDATLHRDIVEATKQITDSANIKLDFGYNASTGKYRIWSTSDTTHQADIRVSFDKKGYFSLVGTDSISPIISSTDGTVGGSAGQRSLNLGGFHIQRPAGWRGTVRHEFLHALAFHHEHQSPKGGCDDEFRWQDDPGYQLTQDVATGKYKADLSGRRPGIYTYLAGPPNGWDKTKVDRNLRQRPASGLTSGSFDQESVMLYRFPALFYRTVPSSCAPKGDGQNLSQGDVTGLVGLYPFDPQAVTDVSARRRGAFDALVQSTDVTSQLKAKIAAQFNRLNTA